jgi:hypothetical protein
MTSLAGTSPAAPERLDTMARRREHYFDRYWPSKTADPRTENWPDIHSAAEVQGPDGRWWARRSSNAKKPRVRELLSDSDWFGLYSFGRQHLVWIPRHRYASDIEKIAGEYSRPNAFGTYFKATVWVAAGPGMSEQSLLVFVEQD